MRHYAVAVSAASLFIATCSAQDAANAGTQTPPTWSGNYSVDLKSRYFGSTVCAIFAGQLVAQQELDVTRSIDGGKTSLTMTIWNSTGFDKWFNSFAYETDFDMNVAHKFGKYTVSGGGWAFLLYPGAGTHVLVLDGKISRSFSNGVDTIEPFFEIQRYTVTNKDVGFHGGTYPMVGTTYTRKLSGRFSLVTQFHENHDNDGGFGKRSGKSLFYADAGMRIAITDSMNITLPRFGIGGSWNDPGRPIEKIWSMEFSKSF